MAHHGNGPNHIAFQRAKLALAIRAEHEHTMIDRVYFTFGCAFGFAGVALGAFGAHALKARLAPEMLAIFEVGVRYQLIHALALLAVAWACTRWPGRLAQASGWLFVAGTLLFSGSLYALTLTGVRALGLVTPIGGVALLLGWLCLLAAPWRTRGDGERNAPQQRG